MAFTSLVPVKPVLKMTRDDHIAHVIAGYIRSHTDSPLSVSKFAEEYHISRYTLERVFKKTFGKTLHQYVMEKRMEEAYRLLTTTDLPIKAIVSQTGFHSVTSFTNAFHSRYQISPAALRNEM